MRSSFCNFGDCVEVEIGPDLVFIRHSQRPRGLTFTREEWAAFLARVRAGEFDLPPATD